MFLSHRRRYTNRAKNAGIRTNETFKITTAALSVRPRNISCKGMRQMTFISTLNSNLITPHSTSQYSTTWRPGRKLVRIQLWEGRGLGLRAEPSAVICTASLGCHFVECRPTLVREWNWCVRANLHLGRKKKKKEKKRRKKERRSAGREEMIEHSPQILAREQKATTTGWTEVKGCCVQVLLILDGGGNSTRAVCSRRLCLVPLASL